MELAYGNRQVEFAWGARNVIEFEKPLPMRIVDASSKEERHIWRTETLR
jgi:hypothetical protein